MAALAPSSLRFKAFKLFNRYAPFNFPSFILPRIAGEERGGGLNDLNGLNVLNDRNISCQDAKLAEAPPLTLALREREWVRVDRQCKCESGAFPQLALYPDPPTVHLDKLSGQR